MKDKQILLSVPGVLKSPGHSHRRLSKDAVTLGDPENREWLSESAARTSGGLPRFLFPQSPEDAGMEWDAAWTLLFFSWSRTPHATPGERLLLGSKEERGLRYAPQSILGRLNAQSRIIIL